MMIQLKIDNKEISVPDGTYVIDAAAMVEVNVPAMCRHPELEPFTSCMVCLVKNTKTGKLFPSCSVRCEEGMEVVTMDDEIFESRKMALELLLSDHVGDCEAPCRIACPAFMNIPLMNRLIAQNKIDDALKIVKQDIALPAVLGRICPAPCEGACRRKTIDEPVSICLLKRYTGDHGHLQPDEIQEKYPGKKVAIIGAGPAGLAAAYYLQLKGISCELFEQKELPGGNLRYAIDDEKLDKQVLQKEIELITGPGLPVHYNHTINDSRFKELVATYDAIVLATGDFKESMVNWGLEHNNKQVLVDKKTYRTNIANVFAIGNVNRSLKLAVRSVGQGKEVVYSIMDLFEGREPSGEPRLFNSRFGKLMQDEFGEYLGESIDTKQVHPNNAEEGFTIEEAKKEAARCMHCDCRKPYDCKLRIYSGEYNAVQKRFSYGDRNAVKKYLQHEGIVYEPEKCIKCGICVRLTEKYKEEFGFTYIGRGFDVKIGVPFNESLAKGLKERGLLVAKACPTGALGVKG